MTSMTPLIGIWNAKCDKAAMIRKLKSGEYRHYRRQHHDRRHGALASTSCRPRLMRFQRRRVEDFADMLESCKSVSGKQNRLIATN
jgi:hypothetical protein